MAYVGQLCSLEFADQRFSTGPYLLLLSRNSILTWTTGYCRFLAQKEVYVARQDWPRSYSTFRFLCSYEDVHVQKRFYSYAGVFYCVWFCQCIDDGRDTTDLWLEV